MDIDEKKMDAMKTSDPLFHPLADVYPQLPAEELSSLSVDISRNGLVHPLVVHNDKIIDGRNRFLAMSNSKKAEIKKAVAAARGGDFADTKFFRAPPPWVKTVDDIEKFIHSVNDTRRHMSKEQSACVAAAKSVLTRQSGNGSGGEPSVAVLSKRYNVGSRYIGYAKVLRDKTPKLFRALRDGTKLKGVDSYGEQVKFNLADASNHVKELSDAAADDFDQSDVEDMFKAISGKTVQTRSEVKTEKKTNSENKTADKEASEEAAALFGGGKTEETAEKPVATASKVEPVEDLGPHDKLADANTDLTDFCGSLPSAEAKKLDTYLEALFGGTAPNKKAWAEARGALLK